MASATLTYDVAAHARLRSFYIPREHGAWGMLLVPLAIGAAAGNPPASRISPILLFAIASLGIFFLRTPVESALGLSPLRPQNEGERRLIYAFIFTFASASLAALSILLFAARASGLLLLGAGAALAFLLQAVLKRLGRSTRLNSQIAGSVALSSTAAGAYYLATGHFGQTALLIWFTNWLFAANQVHFVQLRIHTARVNTLREKLKLGKTFLFHLAFSFLILIALWRMGGFPVLALLAFAPVYARGLAWFFAPPATLQVRKLGLTELKYAIAFGLVFILGFQHHVG
jgi:hypothetical protein